MANNKDFKVKNGIKPTVYHEGVGTVTSGSVTNGYDLSVAAYDSVSFSVSAQETLPQGIHFKPDGTIMYIIGSDFDRVKQYTLSTAWDLTTASYASKDFSVSGQSTVPQGMTMSADGTELYVVGDTGDRIIQYTLSTAWDISTASYTQRVDVSAQSPIPTDVHFKPDGTKMYIVESSGDDVEEYDLSTAWDISTATHNQTFSISSEETTPIGLTFNTSGTKMFVLGLNVDDVNEYTLSTAWDISTATFVTNFSVTTEETSPRGIAFKSDGTKMYIVGATSDTVFQYSTGSTVTTATLDLSTGSVFEITPTSDIQIGLNNPADSGTVSQATLLLDGAVVSLSLSDAVDESKTFSISSQSPNSRDIFFSSDGLKMFTFEDVYLAPYVYAYDLSVAWDVSTASYNGESFDPSANINQLEAGQFSSDGTKLYIVDAGFQDIFQYTLSTAWDLSTASYDSKSFDPSQTTIFDAIAFSYDGTKMYISAASGGVVYQYTLSTAWDISTASYDSKSFDFSTQNSNVRALFFTEDGYSVFSLDYNSHAAYSYTMTTAFDISTASYTGTNYVFSPVNLYGMFVDEGSGKLYIASDSTDTVYQYSIGSPATITYDSTLQFGGGTAPESPAIGETDVLTFSTRDGGTTYQAAIAIDGAV